MHKYTNASYTKSTPININNINILHAHTHRIIYMYIYKHTHTHISICIYTYKIINNIMGYSSAPHFRTSIPLQCFQFYISYGVLCINVTIRLCCSQMIFLSGKYLWLCSKIPGIYNPMSVNLKRLEGRENMSYFIC